MFALYRNVLQYFSLKYKLIWNSNHWTPFINIDAIIYFTITSSVEIKDRNIYGTYTMPTLGGFGTFVTRQHSHEYTTIEAVLVEPASKDKKEFYCSGGAKGSSYDVGYRVFNKMLEHFEEIGISSPPLKK